MFEHLFGKHWLFALDHFTLGYQQPWQKKPGICLVSLEKGTGKSKYLEYQAMFYGNNAVVTSMDRLGQNFNGALYGKNCICIEECLDRKGELENKLKDLVTNPAFQMERKGKETETASFFGTLYMTSNYPSKFIKITDNEDRFAVFNVKKPKEIDPFFLDKLKVEITYFSHFVSKRKMIYENKTSINFIT